MLAHAMSDWWGVTSRLSMLTHLARPMEERKKQAGRKWLTAEQVHLFTNTTNQSMQSMGMNLQKKQSKEHVHAFTAKTQNNHEARAVYTDTLYNQERHRRADSNP